MEWVDMNSGGWQPDNYVGEANFRKLLQKANVSLFTGERLLEDAGVAKDGTTLRSISTEKSGAWTSGQFIDASYEGDVARFAGISATYGRESQATYDEDLAGVRHPAPGFEVKVNASWPDGSPLKYVSATPPGGLASGDDGVMAFSYRTCVTTNASNQAPF